MCDRRSESIKRRRSVASVLLIFFLFLSMAVGVCSAVEAPSAESYAIGCILPLSGRNAAYGNRALDAVLLAAGVFNASKETQIRILIEDSQSEPAVAGAAAAGKTSEADRFWRRLVASCCQKASRTAQARGLFRPAEAGGAALQPHPPASPAPDWAENAALAPHLPC